MMLKVIIGVESGYAGGTIDNPTYQNIGDHAEVIKVEYDPAQINFSDLLTVFFASHDPTTVNRQGADIGQQYRSVILTTTAEQLNEAENFVTDLNNSSEFGEEIVTKIEPLRKFYLAEAVH